MFFNVKKTRLGGNMTKDPENIKDACKKKGNNPFLFITGRTEMTCRLRKEKKAGFNGKKNWALE